MDARLPWAVRNNAEWCDLVCRSNRIQTSFRPRHGFDELFEARWIAYDRPPRRPSTALPWTVVQTEDRLATWTEAPGLTNILGAALLRRPDVRFLAAHDEDGISAGAVVNMTGPVAGASNVFAATIGEDEAWADIPTAVQAMFPNAVPVGYVHGGSLRAAVAAGFREVGPLRVWLAPPAAP
jgi:hypothetical protein